MVDWELNDILKIFSQYKDGILGFLYVLNMKYGLPLWLSDKESACNTGDVGSISGLGSSGEQNDNPLHILASEILWTEKPGGLQSMGSQKSRT